MKPMIKADCMPQKEYNLLEMWRMILEKDLQKPILCDFNTKNKRRNINELNPRKLLSQNLSH